MEMSDIARRAFMILPEAIENFDCGVISHALYVRPDARFEYDQPDPKHKQMRCDITWLVKYYLDIGYLTEDQVATMQSQLESRDRENWLVVFMVLDALKHKLWTDDTT